MKQFKGAFGVILIFLFGAVCGGGAVYAVISHHLHSMARVNANSEQIVGLIARRLRTELDLDDPQKAQLQTIVTETRSKMAAIRQQTQPQVIGALVAAEEKVRGILKPDQVPKFDALVRKGRESWRTQQLKSATAERD